MRRYGAVDGEPQRNTSVYNMFRGLEYIYLSSSSPKDSWVGVGVLLCFSKQCKYSFSLLPSEAKAGWSAEFPDDLVTLL